MKRFVFRSLLFATIVTLLIGGTCALDIWYELSCYYGHEIVASPSATAVLCGDSQMAMGVDPEVSPACFNFSAHGRQMDQDYLTLIDVLNKNAGRLRTVAVDVSPPAALFTYGTPLAEMGYASSYYLLHYLHLRENRRSLTGMGAAFRDHMVGRRLRMLMRTIRGVKKFKSSIAGDYSREPVCLLREDPTRYGKLLNVKLEQIRGFETVSRKSELFVALDCIKTLCQENGVRLVLVTTPWRPDLRARCVAGGLDRFTAVVRDYAEEHGLMYMDFLRTEFPDEMWHDCNHLNHLGARNFTVLLRDALEERKLL